MRFTQFVAGLALVAWVGACSPTSPPFGEILTDSAGNEITVTAIDEILNDSSLSTDEQREQLQDLGITDDKILDLWLSSKIPAL